MAIDWHPTLRDNIARVRATVADACARTGRNPADVCLVAVTKYVSLDVLRAAAAAGLPDIGESRVQQLVARAADFGPTPVPIRWHMLGHLQRNKVKALLPVCRILHSLDSDRLAAALDEQLAALAERDPNPARKGGANPRSEGGAIARSEGGAIARPEGGANGAAGPPVAGRVRLEPLTVDAFLEVNLAAEASKTGVPPDAVPSLAAAVARYPHIRLRGLMTMAPYDPDPAASRPYFARLRDLLARLRQGGAVASDCTDLSMGMSQDYAVAVEEGATFIRVGSALFQGLPTTDPRA